MYNENLINEYIQWLKDTGRMKHELAEVIVNDGGNIKEEDMQEKYNC